jgi:DNA-binding NarL/FixJ family response regulator
MADGAMLPPLTIAAEALDSVNPLGTGNTLNSARRSTTLAGLTPRERDVLRLLAGGMTDREIAETLFISPRTVGGHVSNLLAKLGVDSRTAAAAWAVRNGIV